jgi:DNA invertase Pin-like site-specific DNA recombinase
MKYVNYVRVSSKAQGVSGLGLEAQRDSIKRFLTGKDAEVIAEFTEVETGKSSTRKELQKALDLCQREKATLCIAKLDRLARNLHFITTLQQTKIPFVAVDNPHATPFVIHILCAVAEAEAVAISQRTKAALEACKRRGVKLGAPNPTQSLPAALQAIQERKQGYNSIILKSISEIKSTGCQTLKGIAACLEKRGEKTSRGSTRWTATAVARIIKAQEQVEA